MVRINARHQVFKLSNRFGNVGLKGQVFPHGPSFATKKGLNRLQIDLGDRVEPCAMKIPGQIDKHDGRTALDY